MITKNEFIESVICYRFAAHHEHLLQLQEGKFANDTLEVLLIVYLAWPMSSTLAKFDCVSMAMITKSHEQIADSTVR